MDTEKVIQILSSPEAIVAYEGIFLAIQIGLVVYMLRLRRKRKEEAESEQENQKREMLEKALKNEKRG